MSISTSVPPGSRIIYPEDDGQPMAENTLQFQWIVTIKEGLERAFRDRPDVFVAGDLLWYPTEGEPETRQAPDAMVVFGRPKGYRGSYRQWEEGGHLMRSGRLRGPFAGKPALGDDQEVPVLRTVWRPGVLHLRPRHVRAGGWRRTAERARRNRRARRVGQPPHGSPIRHLAGRAPALRSRRTAIPYLRGTCRRTRPHRQERDLSPRNATIAQERDRLKAQLEALGIEPTS